MKREKNVDATMDPAEILAKMSDLRREILSESTTLVKRTRQTFSWRHQVATHPVMSAALVSAIGYLLVPKRTMRSVQLPEMVAKAMGVDQQIKPAVAETPSLIQTVLMTAGSLLARNALGLAMSQLSNFLTTKHVEGGSPSPNNRQSSGVQPDYLQHGDRE